MTFFLKKNIFLINVFLFFAIAFIALEIFRIDPRSFFVKPICKDCNIILISLDTLGANHLPCYGYDRNTAPNLCKFASENVIFSNSYSNGGWTLPSYFSIFTSLYPKHHGVEKQGDVLDKKIDVLPEILKRNNYKTIYIGSHNDPNQPITLGFDEIMPGDQIDEWQKGYAELIKNNLIRKKTFLYLQTYWVHSPYVVGDAENGNKKVSYTKKYYSNIPIHIKDFATFTEDFYNFLLSYLTNPKMYIRPEYGNLYSKLKDINNLETASKIFKQSVSKEYSGELYNNYYLSLLSKNTDTLQYGKDLYDEMIFYLDLKLKILFDLLKSNKQLADNTIVIITSVHGEAFNEHGFMSHPVDGLYDETTKVPLIMHIPKIKHVKNSDLVQNIDLLPTILDLVGINKPKGASFDGIDLTDSILNLSYEKKNQYLISEGPNIDSIMDKKYKLIINYSYLDKHPEFKLYNLENDKKELVNIAASHKGIVDDLFSNLNRIIYKK